MKTNMILKLALLLSYVAAGSVLADTWYVSTNSPTDGPGTNWATAFHTLQDGIDAATAGDTVFVTNGIYNTGGAVAGLVSSRAAITQAITVESVNGPEVTTIEGAPPAGPTATRCAFVGPGATLRGFTLTNGYTDTSFSSGNEEQASGAGAWIDGGTIDHCILIGNTAELAGGGAVCANAGGMVGRIVNCVVTGNYADNGGGLFFEFGGAASNCLVTGNAAGSGGGGGVYIWQLAGASQKVSLNHCTITDNTSTGDGPEIRFNAIKDTRLSNTIAWGILNGSATSYSNCCTQAGLGVNAVSTDPLFIGSGNYRLQSGSDCIDAGLNGTLATDLDGNARIINGTADIGAYEFINIGQPGITVTNYTAILPSTAGSSTISGTNNAWTVGNLAWTNAANGIIGTVAVSGTAFSISGIPLELSDNLITVSGTNLLGDTASHSVTITRLGAPEIDITNNAATVNGNISAYALSGSNNVWVTGQLIWTNAASSSGSNVPVSGTTFSISDIPLVFSTNLITVSGTNLLGEISSDSLTITRSTVTDTDGDGASDYYEYIADTDMLNSNDLFRVTAYSNAAVFFQSSSNRQYSLLYSTNLLDNIWTNLTGAVDVLGTGGEDSFPATETDDAGYYRIEVKIP